MKTKQTRTLFLSVLAMLLFSTLLSTSCNKEEINQPNRTAVSSKPTQTTYDEPIDSSTIEEFSTKLTSLYSEISTLQSTPFCSLQAILTNEDNTDSDKYTLIQGNSDLTTVYQKLATVNAFMEANNSLMSQIYSTESTAEKNYFIEQFADDLGIGNEAPNADPCSPYWAARKSCSINYIAACLIAAEAGPVSPLAWMILTGSYINCLDDADIAHPNCVNSGITTSIISTIADKQSICE
jgi:hypothetical protein